VTFPLIPLSPKQVYEDQLKLERESKAEEKDQQCEESEKEWK